MSRKIIFGKTEVFVNIFDELKKVDWPDRKKTLRLTLVVIAISLIIGLYIGIIDVILAKGLELITNLK
ncbi:MAG: preprotein translocase subunit SecE [Patescibacteria group bacterium]|nr:preprotein translocase subunit SecE [Patescibacteria group bacterium]